MTAAAALARRADPPITTHRYGSTARYSAPRRTGSAGRSAVTADTSSWVRAANRASSRVLCSASESRPAATASASALAVASRSASEARRPSDGCVIVILAPGNSGGYWRAMVSRWVRSSLNAMLS